MFIMCLLAFTSLPYWARYSLGVHKGKYNFKPGYIIMLGGNGMPSEDNLMRLYYTADIGTKYNLAKIILAHPDSMIYGKMKKELIIKGIDSTRIFFETKGKNTRAEALNIAAVFPEAVNAKVVIVSSPEHIYRAFLVFRKAGFTNIGACPSFENDVSIDLTYDERKLGGRKHIPDIAKNISMRYNFWSYFKLEITCLREYMALGYYYIKGWI